jgi:hypothetical protein
LPLFVDFEGDQLIDKLFAGGLGSLLVVGVTVVLFGHRIQLVEPCKRCKTPANVRRLAADLWSIFGQLVQYGPNSQLTL